MRQLTIYERIEKKQKRNRTKKTMPGEYSIVDKLRDSMSEAIENCPLSRPLIAGEMSHLLDANITKAQIDTWTRKKSDDGQNIPNKRHVPAEYLHAFCKVTGSNEPIFIISEKLDLLLVPEPSALEAEIQREKEEMKRQKDKIKQQESLLAELKRRTGKRKN